LFPEQTEQSVVDAVARLERHPLTDAAAIRNNALRFSDERFDNEFRNFVQNAMRDFHSKRKSVK
jgi:hypothetical protein